jgi:hypothetical protein
MKSTNKKIMFQTIGFFILLQSHPRMRSLDLTLRPTQRVQKAHLQKKQFIYITINWHYLIMYLRIKLEIQPELVVKGLDEE